MANEKPKPRLRFTRRGWFRVWSWYVVKGSPIRTALIGPYTTFEEALRHG